MVFTKFEGYDVEGNSIESPLWVPNTDETPYSETSLLPDLHCYDVEGKKKLFERPLSCPNTIENPSSQTFTLPDLYSFGKGRLAAFSFLLDSLENSVSGMASVDPKEYLSALNCIKTMTAAEMSHYKNASYLFKSLTRTNPKHPLAWIAAARLEELAGNLPAAKKLLHRGCQECPNNEDIWLESCRFASPDDAKALVAKAIKSNTTSEKLWLHASALEDDRMTRCKILAKGIEHVPHSITLRKSIWITLSKLEDVNGNKTMVGELIKRALEIDGTVIDRGCWLKEAQAAERDGAVLTCEGIISNTIGRGVNEEDRKEIWLADADECTKRGYVVTARAIYARASTVFLNDKSVWLKVALFEKSHGTRESLCHVLSGAVRNIPHADIFSLMRAREELLNGNVPDARQILEDAIAKIPDSEELWLSLSKLEFQNHKCERARTLLAEARQIVGTERIWMKSAIFERELGSVEEEKKLLNEGLDKFPSFFKLWLMLGQLEERLAENAKQQGQPEKRRDHMTKAKMVFERGLKNCPKCVPLVLSLAKIEEELNGPSKARAVLTVGRKKNPQNPELWLAAVRAELKHGNQKEADILMAKALQECPNSGILWAASIEMVSCPQRQTKSIDALKKCDQDPHVIVAVAKLFWHDREVEKARTWLNRAVTLAPYIGDFWALCYKFEMQHGTEDRQKDVLKRCVAAQPKRGEIWQAISKAVENSHQPTESILKKVVIAIGNEENSFEKW